MDGFILSTIEGIVAFFQKINIVEYIKKFAVRIHKNTIENDMIRVSNMAIDIYIILKWLILVMLLYLKVSGWISIILVIYLMTMNIHTYFYYHFWSEKAIIAKARSINHIRRKFISSMQAIGFNILSFAYLYYLGFSADYIYKDGYSRVVASISHSILTTFSGGSGYIEPTNNIGLLIQLSQVMSSFIFIGIILSKSDSIEERKLKNGL